MNATRLFMSAGTGAGVFRLYGLLFGDKGYLLGGPGWSWVPGSGKKDIYGGDSRALGSYGNVRKLCAPIFGKRRIHGE